MLFLFVVHAVSVRLSIIYVIIGAVLYAYKLYWHYNIESEEENGDGDGEPRRYRVAYYSQCR